MVLRGLEHQTKIISLHRYSPEQLFAVVAAVDFYEDFLPWCQRSEIIRHHADGSFDAELEIGFKFLVESYVSHVVLDKPKFVKGGRGRVRLPENEVVRIVSLKES
ncbi:Coenzyme Q-binding protein COQ10-like protein mitochondrial [Bienertia sinuspersici]